MMKTLRKIMVIAAVFMLAVCGTLVVTDFKAYSDDDVPAGETVRSGYGDWEFYYEFNKSIMQRHVHPRQLLRLPLYRQSTNYTSGVACVQSILRYGKYEFDIRENNLANALGATEEDGVRWEKIVGYLNAVRYNDTDMQWFRAEKRESMTVEGLIAELDQGHPVILAIQAWNWNEDEEYTWELDYSNQWECGHWVVAVGYDKNNLFFMDPSTAGNYTYIPKDKLVNRWHDYDVDEDNHRYETMQLGIVVTWLGDHEPDGERYQDAFYGLF